MPKSKSNKTIANSESNEDANQQKSADSQKAKRVSQSDIPRRSLREALTVAQALTDSFASSPTAPHQIAMSLEISPTSSSWRDLTGATVAYGLTKGGYNSDKLHWNNLG